jgi:hypothetical protein
MPLFLDQFQEVLDPGNFQNYCTIGTDAAEKVYRHIQDSRTDGFKTYQFCLSTSIQEQKNQSLKPQKETQEVSAIFCP